MRIILLLSLIGMAACSRQQDKPVDTTAIAASRAKANIERYAAAKARFADRTTKPASR